MAKKGTRTKKPVTVDSAATKVSSILASFNASDRKAVVKQANKILRLVSKLSTSNGQK